MADLVAVLKQQALEMHAEIKRLQGEAAELKRLLAAQPFDVDDGIITVAVPPNMTAEQYIFMIGLWKTAWEERGRPAPAVFPVVDGLAVEKLTYDNFGLYTIRV